MTHPGDIRDSLCPLKKRIVTRQIAAKPWSMRTYENFVMDNLWETTLQDYCVVMCVGALGTIKSYVGVYALLLFWTQGDYENLLLRY